MLCEGTLMSLRFHWFLPTNGDGRDIVGGGHGVATGAAGTIRPASLAYLGQIARSAEQLGFEAALTPTGAWCEDAWLATAMLTEVTERLKFLVAFHALAVEVHLRPLLGELGATVPARGLYVTEPEFADLGPAIGRWSAAAFPLLGRALR